ncbi:uncharacterized protein LOC124158017 [Ischnura elegans]|uniref:uncharacterized protein LOC124158017 n=1 Tax=Ischnura elegans TaxID=197161 RepID=UPI001ED8AC94|nr:uncharacterized protein LOC124158017 [Ischnura elegans]XP_046389117.1 uncharacterized protein LOC124158017 [Ischnura elegans]XP_046389118.1 uncharacterized protein LOC124158017 [Ischnura elegans]XP_046389119.1 uncharacterized protein LOC124158017 [Ischnura elegans]
MASTRAMCPFAVCLVLLCCQGVMGQVSWTHIYVDGNSQIDLWTMSGTGCSCPAPGAAPGTPQEGAGDCACCVKDGGCPCGAASPRRCTQCGLEQHCVHMCNMTIDARALQSRSGKSFGQIKSPSLVGPGSCWYLLLADRNQRIEIQVYRLVSVGHFNGTSCESGFLELSEGSDVLGRKGSSSGNANKGGISSLTGGASGLQLCGQNERFAPPAVLFADRSSATLLFHVAEPTLRSQFFAYFSFTPADHSTLGIPYRGGKRVEHTECDWVYQEHLCKSRGRAGARAKTTGATNKEEGEKTDRDEAGCLLASPGHPGVYPPNRQCKYLVTMSSLRTRVNLTFISLQLPHNHCDTDYINIYKGSTTSSPLLTTICGSRKAQVEYSGPNMLIEFSSGPPVPPYDYNGFVAQLEFIETPEETAITETSVGVPVKTTEPGLLMDETLGMPRRIPNTICDYVYFGNTTRSGHFDTRAKGWLQGPSVISGSASSTKPAPITCKFIFYGRNSDIVHMSLFNYDLRAASCESSVEVYDGKAGKNGRSLQKLCSPLTRYARDQSGRFLEQQTLVSTGNILTIVFRRGMESSKEFLDGAFLFHDERVEGTLQPSTLCDVVYDGASRGRGSGRREGQFIEPVAGRAPQLLWNVEGPLRCSQRFDLVPGQAITLKVDSAMRLSRDPHCTTRCQKSNGIGGVLDEDLGGGCSCLPNLIPLSQMDYLLILTADGSRRHVSCLCGDFQDALPLAVKSTTSLIVEYRVAHYSWATRGFGFKASYKFEDENSCGERVKTENSGVIESRNRIRALPPSPRNYYHESCTWLLHSQIERQLTVEVSTADNKPCNIWNITLLQYRDNTVQEELDRTTDDRVGQVLYTFCPRQRRKVFKLPWKQSNVFLRLSSLSDLPPDYSVRWKSQIVRANNRVAAPAQEGMSGESNRSRLDNTVIIVATLFLLRKRWELASVAA